MLTKSDLSAIKNHIKESLNGFATKDDLKGLATQKDLTGLARGNEIDNLRITFVDNLTQWKSDLFGKIDKVLGRVTTAEDENAILRARDDGRKQERDEFEPRLKKLEDIHPGNRHQVVT